MTAEAAAKILGVILAGGLSRRMEGKEKSLIALAGKPLIAHVTDRLSPQVASIIVNANGEASRFEFLGQPVVADTISGHAGPLAGILTGMRWAEVHAPELRFIATAATDTPFFPADLVARLVEAGGSKDDRIVLATSGGYRHPVFGLWPVALADDLEAFLHSGQGGKVMRFVSQHDLAEVEFDLMQVEGETIDPFFNVNTPEEFEQAQLLAMETAHAG